MRAELIADCRNAHGEGVLWSADHRLLMWTDIHGEALWTFAPDSLSLQSYPTPGRLCCFAPLQNHPPTKLVAAFASGFAFFDLLTGERTDIAPFEPELPHTRLNDGRTDRRGRLIAGGMDEEALAPISSVWRLDPDLKLTKLFDGVSCANSTCFSPDGREMYFADSPRREIVGFAYDPDTGRLGNKRTVAHVDGIPDGSCVDSDGCIWNAVWEGYRVERWSPTGKLLDAVEVPVCKPTCCAFGGNELDTLYITTSRLGEPDERLAKEPTAGSLYAVNPGVRGLKDTPFGNDCFHHRAS